MLDFRPDNKSNITDTVPASAAHPHHTHSPHAHADGPCQDAFCTVVCSAYRDCTHSKHASKPFTPYVSLFSPTQGRPDDSMIVRRDSKGRVHTSHLEDEEDDSYWDGTSPASKARPAPGARAAPSQSPTARGASLRATADPSRTASPRGAPIPAARTG